MNSVVENISAFRMAIERIEQLEHDKAVTLAAYKSVRHQLLNMGLQTATMVMDQALHL